MPRRRRKLGLGATNRRGPRTGAVHVDERQLDRVARKLVSKFGPDDRCQDGDVMIDDARVRAVQVRTAAGDVRTIDVEVRPRRHREPGSEGYYAPSKHLVRITPSPRVCGRREDLKETIKKTLRHELAHVTDPQIRPERARSDRSSYRRPHETHCDYVNDPLEIVARLAETRAEFAWTAENTSWLRRAKRDGERLTTGDVRLYSPTYASVERCLTPANRRRFWKVAARIWESLPNAKKRT